MEHVEKYKIFQKELVGTKEGNPFKDIIIKTSFINENLINHLTHVHSMVRIN